MTPVRLWAYDYSKDLVLEEGKAVLRIEHRLVNTGKNRMEAEQYAHNFIAIDGRPPEKGLTVEFSFEPKTSADISKIGVIEGKSFIITSDAVPTSYIPIEGWDQDSREEVWAKIKAPNSPAAVRIGGDFIPSKMALFITKGQISCEPFVKLSLEPGHAASWTRHYEFLIDEK